MDILCNDVTCRKPLTGDLWVTRCYHIFCDVHGRVFRLGKENKCPACGTVLSKCFDVVHQNSSPAEDMKSMLLLGVRPEVVLDIATRAISFWNFQVAQEYSLQCQLVKHAQDNAEKVKDIHNASLLRLRNELLTTRRQCDGHEKVVDSYERRLKDLTDQINGKDRQIQKMQRVYNALRMKKQEKLMGQNSSKTTDFDNVQQNHQGGAQLKPNKRDQEDFVFEPCLSQRNK